jgi:hypothetical protein
MALWFPSMVSFQALSTRCLLSRSATKSAIKIVAEGRFRRPLYGTFAAFPERAGIARHVDGVTR